VPKARLRLSPAAPPNVVTVVMQMKAFWQEPHLNWK
jgi:hypothetical protein